VTRQKALILLRNPDFLHSEKLSSCGKATSALAMEREHKETNNDAVPVTKSPTRARNDDSKLTWKSTYACTSGIASRLSFFSTKQAWLVKRDISKNAHRGD